MPDNTQHNKCNHCEDHTGLEARIEHMEKNNEVQWRKIDKINTRGTTTLTVIVLTLLGVIGNLVMVLVKG